MTNTLQQFWRGRTAAFGTMHQKEAVVSPILEQQLGLHIRVPEGFNSDQFGTFTRDITRTGNQLETARLKARAAMATTGLDIGIASEGSFAPHPELPFILSNLEIVVLLDDTQQLEIIGHARASAQVNGQAVSSAAEAVALASSWGFPHIGVILRQGKDNPRHIYKELTNQAQLEQTAQTLLKKFLVSSIYLETDLRAHRNPERRETITLATQDLAKNCQSQCPACHAPGFVVCEVKRGLPCSGCGTPTELARTLVSQCQKCQHQEEKAASIAVTADPGHCLVCNP